MKRLLAYIGVVLLACGCGLDEPVLPGAGGSQIEFSASKMRIITKAGDSAETFVEGTDFRLFAVQSGTGWASDGTKFYNIEGTGGASGKVDYSIDGKKASYDVGKNLDFYGLTYGTSSEVPITGDAGSAPAVSLSLAGDSFPDLMYSDNLKNKNSSSGLLQMEFRHTLSKLKFEVLKQDETADDDKKLTNVLLQKVVLKGSAVSAVFNAGSGEWSYETSSVEDRVVYDQATGLKITESAQMLKSGEDEIEMLAVPNSGQLTLEVTLDMDGDTGNQEYKVVEYALMASQTEKLVLEQNHEYTFSIVVLKNDVRIVTVTPKVYEWIDVDLTQGEAYLGQPVYFGGLMWMDRNLGAKSADCENDWYNSIGYYYQFGRNVPFILDVKAYLASFSSLNGFSFKLSQGTKGDPDAIYEMRAIYTLNDKGEKVTTAKYANRRDGTCLYDHVAINPGETDKEYSYIMGLTTESTPKTW
ncbi:MAG: fimbrillin family protein, partial [Bacteroidales bacterium]|nr:fimbrillin family protein [Bacteroidales bacterium]